MPLLELKNVTKYYDKGTPAISDISFVANEGEFISVIGPSGAGKSTILRCINRMIEASSGEIIFDSQDILKCNKRNIRAVRTKIGMIFQQYNLVERMSVIENVLHGRLGHKSTLAGIAGSYTDEEKKYAFKIIDMLGLTDQVYKRCDQLSGGQKQRVGIARALVQKPKIILCDEPISSLDPNSSKIIMDYLKSISSEMKITLIVNLHQVEISLKYSDRIIGVNSGKIVFDGPAKDMTSENIHNVYNIDNENSNFDLGEKYEA
ncbi:MAG: phosphonate ABC transporter ATP-binding protein [Bacillota bacterium]|nr:phosphonate ABC transporter ATP-binding protein [Bacillota bacterium]